MTRRGAAPLGPFEVAERLRPFELLDPGFVGVQAPPGRADGLTRSAYSPPAPFVTVEAGVEGARAARVLVGLAAPDGDHVLAFHDPRTGRTGLELCTGTVSTVLAARRLFRRVRRLALAVCGGEVTVLADTGRGWRPVVTGGSRVVARVDLRVPATLARYTAAWGARGGPARLGPVRAGLFGRAGLRDLHLVQHADGTPYVRAGRMFLTATCAGLGFFPQAHWGVFAFDPERPGGLLLEQTAHLFTLREGLLLGDHAGQIVRDGDRWLVANSSWGDFAPHRGVHVRDCTTTADVLRGVHILATERTPLPTQVSSWDPGMTRIDGRWHVSYVESPSQQPFEFHPALAAGPPGTGPWTAELEALGAAVELTQCEGPVLARVDGPERPWAVLASDGHARRFPAFDLAMRAVGTVDAPYGSNIPHPQVVDLPGGRRMIVTFDGTPYAPRVLGYGTHGNVVVMREVQKRAQRRARPRSG